MKKKMIIVILAIVVIVAVAAVVIIKVLGDKDDEYKPKKVKTFNFEVGEAMAFLAKDEGEKNAKTVYVKYSPVLVYTDEDLIKILPDNKNLIISAMEKYFNNKTESQIRKMRGKNIENDKDRIEMDLEEIVKDVLGVYGETVERVLFVEFVIN